MTSATPIRFYVPHRGFSYPCIFWLKGSERISAIDINRDAMRARLIRQSGEIEEAAQDWEAGRAELSAKLTFLTDLLHCGLPWAALITCRNSAGLFGSIIEAAEARRQEAERPYRSPAARESGR
jgi:hypothetical protein